VSYSTTGITNQDVLATLTGCSKEVVANATGHLFTGNGSFTFTFTDSAGNSNSVVAMVNNIDKTALEILMVNYTPNLATSGSVFVMLVTNKAIQTPEDRTAIGGNAMMWTREFSENT
jgi:hypothetical protein